MAKRNTSQCVRFLSQGLIALVLMAGLAPSHGAVVSSVQRGSLASSGNGTVTAPIAAVDPSKSFLVFQTRHDSNRPVGSMVRGRIASPTSVEFVRVTNQTASAITFDASSNANASYQATLSWSHTIGTGSDRKLIVGVAVEEETPGNEVVTGITYGGAALTFARSASITDVGGPNAGYTQRVEIWYLDEASLPAAGSYPVQVNLTGVSRRSAGRNWRKHAVQQPEHFYARHHGHRRSLANRCRGQRRLR